MKNYNFKRGAALVLAAVTVIIALFCLIRPPRASAESAENGAYSGVYAEIDEYLAQASAAAADYLTENVLNPLGMAKTALTQEKSEKNGLYRVTETFSALT